MLVYRDEIGLSWSAEPLAHVRLPRLSARSRFIPLADLATTLIVRLEGDVSELFDVAVIPGVRRPIASGFLNDEVHRLHTFET